MSPFEKIRNANEHVSNAFPNKVEYPRRGSIGKECSYPEGCVPIRMFLSLKCCSCGKTSRNIFYLQAKRQFQSVMIMSLRP